MLVLKVLYRLLKGNETEMLQPADRFGGAGVPGSGISLLHCRIVIFFRMNIVFIENIFSSLKTKNGVPPCGVYAISLNDLLCSVIYSVNAGVEGIAPPLGAERAHCLYCVF